MIDKKIIQWNNINAILMITGMIAALLGYQVVFPVLAFISFAWFFVLMEKKIRMLSPAYGPGNWVTLFRLIGLLILLICYNQMNFLSIGIMAFILVAFDALDGFVARKTNTVSEFGAWFDMETDAFYVALMGVILYQSGLIGAWILIPGFLRYVYSLGVWLFGVSEKQETSSKFGKYIAGLMFVSLPLPFIIPLNIASVILMIATAAIIFSFGRSTILLINT
jgi:phosphatidylglycerophosphate synthase